MAVAAAGAVAGAAGFAIATKVAWVVAGAVLGVLAIAILTNPDVMVSAAVAIASGVATIARTFEATLDEADTKESETDIIPPPPDDPIVFPADPNSFLPSGLNKVQRDGSKNGAVINWMDPLTNTEVFRWDENPNYPNGPHYHIVGSDVHYYPGDQVPEPFASIYF